MRKISVTLRVSGDKLDPDSITQITGLSPTKKFKAGDQSAQHGRAASLVKKYGYWGFTVESEDVSQLSHVIRDILSRTPADLTDLSKAQDGLVDLFVGMFDIRDQSTCELEADVMRELGSRQWPIVFDMYIE
ncbi:MAG: DUF4279 domain-containing protein [Phycisphaerales bacterium]|nr:DUF4279 domain-containing protein [Phycisphaerales bacterium]